MAEPKHDASKTIHEERDYVLGTHDEEIARLGLQHLVWRARAIDAWQRAGFNVGQSVIDIGCGPGYASIDLAEIVGPKGKVYSVDRSKRFLQTLESVKKTRGLGQISTANLDLDHGAFPVNDAHGAWARWVFSFVTRPRDLLARVRDALRPGGVLVLHEYFDYAAWRLAPVCPELEDFVSLVMESWREAGGEPDIGLDLPTWLAKAGFEILSLRPIIEVISPGSFMWQWPKAFIQSGLRRLVELGQLNPARAATISDALSAAEADPHTRMITPAVLEIIAAKPDSSPR